MEALQNLIPEPYFLALGWMIVHAVWQVAGVGLLLWLSLRLFEGKSAAFKYRLSLSALAVITTLAIGTFVYSFPSRDLTADISPATWELIQAQDQLGQGNSTSTAEWWLLAQRIETWIPTLVQVWFLGAMLFFVRLATSLADIRALKMQAHQSTDARWEDFLKEKMCSLGLDKKVLLLQSHLVDMPMTFGHLKPIILLPAGLFFQLSPAQIEAIIAHELAHIHRRDYLANLAQSCLEVIFFFHPVFWWISKNVREQRENAADDLVINLGISPRDLAESLAAVVNLAKKQVPEMALAAAKKSTPTLDRIKRIMGVKTSPNQPTTLTTFTMMITLLLGATLLVGASEPKSDKQNDAWDKTNLHSASHDVGWMADARMQFNDTVPNKPKIIVRIDGDSTIERPMTPKEQAEFSRKMTGAMMPLMDMQVLMKDLDPALFGTMPILELPLVPMPPMTFESIPVWEFGDMPTPLPIEDFMLNIPPFDFDFKYDFDVQDIPPFPFGNDSTKMSKEEWAKKKMEQEAAMKKWSEENSAKMKEWEAKHKDWEAKMQPKIKEWEANMKPKMEEWEAKMKEWEKSQEPRLKEYQEKMKAWEEKNKPAMEEFQRKMEAWEKENQVKLEQYQLKMEAWQREHQQQLQELQQQLQESTKKGGN
jgi:bla regulator protein blaR1